MTATRTRTATDGRLLKMKAEVFKAFAHPLRMAIIEVLSDKEACVCKIAQTVRAERSNVSRHLALMVKAGVLASRKEGLMVYYSLKTCCVTDFLTCVDDMLRRQLAEDGRTLRALVCRRGGAHA